MTTLMIALALVVPVAHGVTKDQGDLSVTNFSLPQGKVTVYLPTDTLAGDTVSGTVIAVPSGSGEDAVKNGAVLNGYVVEVGGQKPGRKGTSPSWAVPVGAATLTIALRDSDGKEVASSTCALRDSQYANSPSQFGVDPVVANSTPVQVRGPFDGDSANTTAQCGESTLVPLAESPRSCVFAGVPERTGPTTIVVHEGDASPALGTCLVSVKLTASRTTLLQGEHGTLTMTVAGLEGLPDTAYPVPCEITNESPSVVHLDKTTDAGKTRGETYAFAIESSSVSRGVATFNIGLTGVNPGPFLLRGVCFDISIHNVKKAMDAQTFNAWVRGLIAGYNEKIKKLEEEEKSSPNAGRRLNIARKKKIVEVLEGFTPASNADLDVAKTAVDKSLADDAFFSMAGELIGLAADLLGYTDIPMPGVGTIVKGMKAVAGAAKLIKVVEALETAEKLIEEYNKLSDAKEKLEKVGKIKEALDKAKEALDNSK